MSDEVKPARRWRFQVHLSTAIVLMCVAGGLIWMNVDEGNDVECLIVRSGGVGIRQCYVSRAYGYPIVARSHLLYNSMGFVWTCCARKMEVRFWKCGIGRTLWTRRAIRRVVPLRTANPPPRGTESDIEFPFTTAQNLLKLEHDWADDLFQRIYGADVFGISANAGRLGKSLFLGVRSIVEFNSRERFASPPVAR